MTKLWNAERNIQLLSYRSASFPDTPWKLRFKLIPEMTIISPCENYDHIRQEFVLEAQHTTQNDTVEVKSHDFWKSYDDVLNSYFEASDRRTDTSFDFFISEHGFETGIYIENLTTYADINVWFVRNDDENHDYLRHGIDPHKDWSASRLLWKEADLSQTSAHIPRDSMYGFEQNKFVLGFEYWRDSRTFANLYFEISIETSEIEEEEESREDIYDWLYENHAMDDESMEDE